LRIEVLTLLLPSKVSRPPTLLSEDKVPQYLRRLPAEKKITLENILEIINNRLILVRNTIGLINSVMNDFELISLNPNASAKWTSLVLGYYESLDQYITDIIKLCKQMEKSGLDLSKVEEDINQFFLSPNMFSTAQD